MKVDFTQKVYQLDGQPLKVGNNDIWHEVTIKDVVVESLLFDYPEDKGITGNEKVERWDLSKKIYLNKERELELDVPEINIIKNYVAKKFPPLIVGQTWHLIGN